MQQNSPLEKIAQASGFELQQETTEADFDGIAESMLDVTNRNIIDLIGHLNKSATPELTLQPDEHTNIIIRNTGSIEITTDGKTTTYQFSPTQPDQPPRLLRHTREETTNITPNDYTYTEITNLLAITTNALAKFD